MHRQSDHNRHYMRLCKIRKLNYIRLRECIGIYRHVVVNIVLFFATCMYTVVWGYDVQCMQAQRTIQWTQRIDIYRDKIYIQRTNRMGLW